MHIKHNGDSEGIPEEAIVEYIDKMPTSEYLDSVNQWIAGQDWQKE